jgi:hypothetical protein
MGRPKLFDDQTEVCIHARAGNKLQEASDRRAVVQLLVDNGGIMTIGNINRHFGFDMTDKVGDLVRSGWLAKRQPEVTE